MAKFSQALLGSLTQSPLKQGMFDLGQTISAAPGVAAQRSADSKAMVMVNAAIASNDPQQLLQAAQTMRTIDPAIATKLAGLAQQATQAQKDLVREQDEARASRGVQGGLAAISQAAARGVPLEQLNEAMSSVIAQDGTQADILNAYNEGKQKPTNETVTSKFYDVLDDQGNTVQMEQFYRNGVPVGEPVNLGVTKQPEVKAPKTNYGLTKDSTEADYNAAILNATNSGNTEDATKLEQRRETLFGGIPTKEAVELARAVNPDFDKHLEFRDKAETLSTILAQGGAGAQALAERELTAFTDNDVKAVAELERFRASTSLMRRVQDGFKKLFEGKASDITNQEYQAMGEALSGLANVRIQRTIETLYSSGDEDAGDKLFYIYVNAEDARVVSGN